MSESRTTQLAGALLRRGAREEALELLCSGTFEGTPALISSIVAESRIAGLRPGAGPDWRPIRAAATRALADVEPRTWMTPAEFSEWLIRVAAANRKLYGAHPVTPIQQIGMSSKRKLRILRGEVAVTKVEALACAHVAIGFPLPVEISDVAGFADWAVERFGSFEKLAAWLGVGNTTITDRLRGFDIVKGERVPKEPEPGLLRAMDWVARCGPFCPYGERG